VSTEAATEAAIEEIADKVDGGTCILFLGAGVHHQPPENSAYRYSDEDRPPMGNELASRLAERSDFASRFPNEVITLPRVALDYQEQFASRRALVDQIIAQVSTGKRPSPIVRALAGLNFPLVITTNYDKLFEKAVIGVGKEPEVIVYQKDRLRPPPIRSDPDRDHPLILKMHGDVDMVDDIVITDEDYIDFIGRMNDKDPFNPIPMYVRERLTRWSTLFIGYSLMDYNLRLLFRTLRWMIDAASFPDTFSVDFHPDALVVRVWQDRRGYVRYIVQDVWEFVPDLYHRVTGHEMGEIGENGAVAR
jgi:hypothetical protein